MDSTYSITGDASSKQHSWARDQISQLVHQIRLDRHDGASLNSSASEHQWLVRQLRIGCAIVVASNKKAA